jgi:hypothetical protein
MMERITRLGEIAAKDLRPGDCVDAWISSIAGRIQLPAGSRVALVSEWSKPITVAGMSYPGVVKVTLEDNRLLTVFENTLFEICVQGG